MAATRPPKGKPRTKSGVQVGSFVALLVGALIKGSDQAILWLLMVGGGRRWWAFDGLETAQGRALTAQIFLI